MPVRDIRVQDRGSFFDDSFFKESWDDFERAMWNVLDRFDNQGTKNGKKTRPECHDIYRRIRTNKIDDDMYTSQALQITEKDGNFQVVIDVRDFNPRNLQVKVVEEKVVLEGRYDKISEDGKSSNSKAFYKEFLLPSEADIDKISTALSKDGVLTIKAPKKEGLNTSNTMNINASKLIQNAINTHRFGADRNEKCDFSDFPNSGNFDNLDVLTKDMKSRLVVSGKDSGRSSSSTSPIPSGLSNASSCMSPTPSETSSEASRLSSITDRGKHTYEKGENSFKMDSLLNQSSTLSNPMLRDRFGIREIPQSVGNNLSSTNIVHMPTERTSAALGSGGTASISVKEEGDKRTLTSERSSLVQQKDGFLESKEITAEVTGKNNQAARREAITRMMKSEDDPEGRFSKSEAADASDISESCVQHLSDGSVVSVKKNSTSTSNFKQFISSTPCVPGHDFFQSEFPSTFRNIPSMMGRGNSLLSQMSSDSLASSMSTMSSNMSSRLSDMSQFTDLSSGFHSSSPFGSRTSNILPFPTFTNMNSTSQYNSAPQMPENPGSNVKRSFSSSQSSFSSFDSGKK